MEDFRLEFNSLKTKKEMLENEFISKVQKFKSLEEEILDLTEAREIITKISTEIQLRLKDKIETLVTLGLNSVFDEEFKFKLEFEKKRNKLECRPVVTENGFEMNPKDDMGGSALDIISFILRIVLINLEEPRPRMLIVIDEPFRQLGAKSILGGEIIKQLSHKMNMQIIMATHNSELKDIADKCWEVEKINGISCVKEIS